MIAAIALIAATSCVNSHSYSHTHTALGSQTWTWTTEHKCGHDYQKWTHRSFQSYTGSVSDEHTYRDEMRYPHYTQRSVLESISAKGTVTWKVTNTSG